MKRIFQIFVATFAVACLFVGASAMAQEMNRADFMAKFRAFEKEGGKAYDAMLAQTPKAKGAGGKEQKYNIAPMSEIVCPTSSGVTCDSGIMVWFQLDNGNFVNPTHHKWQRKERFKVFVRVPVPVYVALYQNYLEDRLPSRQVYPDLRYPETFEVIPPGMDICLPVTFEMDNDLRDEIMSMVVTRIDDPSVIEYVPSRRPIGERPTNNTTTNVGSSNITNQSGTIGIGGVMKASSPEIYKYMQQQNDLVLRKENPKAKFIISGCNFEYGEKADDVAFFMLSPGKTAQWQLTLKKD